MLSNPARAMEVSAASGTRYSDSGVSNEVLGVVALMMLLMSALLLLLLRLRLVQQLGNL